MVHAVDEWLPGSRLKLPIPVPRVLSIARHSSPAGQDKATFDKATSINYGPGPH